MNKRAYIQVLLYFVVWRLGLFVVSVLAPAVLPYRPSFAYAFTILPLYDLPLWLSSWANFDGLHYMTIAEIGYIGTGLIQAFFPLFPLAVQILHLVINNTILAGLLISNLSTLVLMYLWRMMVQDVAPELKWWQALSILFLFPTAFFFGAVYNESLFMCLVIGSFLAARRQKWWLAGVLAGMASGTRVVGVLLVPSLMLELYWQQYQTLTKNRRKVTNLTVIQTVLAQHKISLVWIMLGLSGLASYMWFLVGEYHDALYFLHVQAAFGAGRQEQLILYPQVIWRYIKILLTYRPIDLKYFAFVQEAVVGTMALAGILLSFKEIRPSYVLFSLGAFLVPTLTGTFSSLPRYILVSFSLHLLLIIWFKTRGWLLRWYLLGSSILLMVNTILFIQGYWVA